MWRVISGGGEHAADVECTCTGREWIWNQHISHTRNTVN